jgi:hypothetical protein
LGYIGVTRELHGGEMPRSGVLEKSSKTLADLDAFVDESIDAKSEKELSVFKKLARKIMAGSKHSPLSASHTAHEKVRSV